MLDIRRFCTNRSSSSKDRRVCLDFLLHVIRHSMECVYWKERNIQERFYCILNEHQSQKAVYFGTHATAPRNIHQTWERDNILHPSRYRFTITPIKMRVPYSSKILAEITNVRERLDVVYAHRRSYVTEDDLACCCAISINEVGKLLPEVSSVSGTASVSTLLPGYDR